MAKKKLKKKVRISIIVMLLTVVLAIIIAILLFTGNKEKTKPVKVIQSIDQYGYTLTKNKTKLYKSIFKELEEELNKKEVNYETYASLIAKLFIVDFYDLDSKIAKTDIGGLQFIYPDIKDNFTIKAEETLYKYVENNLDGKRKQILPKVNNVNIDNIESIEYSYNKKKYLEAYEIDLSWEYSKNLGYETNTKMKIIKENKILFIIELD